MTEHYKALWPDTTTGERLVVEKWDDGIQIRVEKTLPERAALMTAQRIDVLERIMLEPEQARWVYERLGEAIKTLT